MGSPECQASPSPRTPAWHTSTKASNAATSIFTIETPNEHRQKLMKMDFDRFRYDFLSDHPLFRLPRPFRMPKTRVVATMSNKYRVATSVRRVTPTIRNLVHRSPERPRDTDIHWNESLPRDRNEEFLPRLDRWVNWYIAHSART